MDGDKKKKKDVPAGVKKKRPKHSGFDAPAIGVEVPDDVVEKQNPDGTCSLYTPDGKKWKP